MIFLVSHLEHGVHRDNTGTPSEWHIIIWYEKKKIVMSFWELMGFAIVRKHAYKMDEDICSDNDGTYDQIPLEIVDKSECRNAVGRKILRCTSTTIIGRDWRTRLYTEWDPKAESLTFPRPWPVNGARFIRDPIDLCLNKLRCIQIRHVRTVCNIGAAGGPNYRETMLF